MISPPTNPLPIVPVIASAGGLEFSVLTEFSAVVKSPVKPSTEMVSCRKPPRAPGQETVLLVAPSPVWLTEAGQGNVAMTRVLPRATTAVPRKPANANATISLMRTSIAVMTLSRSVRPTICEKHFEKKNARLRSGVDETLIALHNILVNIAAARTFLELGGIR